jgi:hypothetical protein
MKNNIKIKYNGGAAMMVLVVFFVFISLTILMGIVTPTVREYRTATDNFKSKQTYFLAESGIEDVVYRLKNSIKTAPTQTLVLGTSQATTTITNLSVDKKKISTLGDTNSIERKVEVTLNTATGSSFNYGVQVGQGGVYLDSGMIYGNVYANGPITASSSGSNLISGTAISANSPSLVTDQSNGTGTPAANIIFGNATATQDIAQGFRVTTASPLNKVQLYIKKTSSPSDATVKIMDDASGNIGTNVLASGTLASSLVTTSYGWIEVAISPNVILDPSKNYWMVIDSGTSSNKYYTIGGTTGNAYTNGASKIGQLGGTWNTTNANTSDYYFNIYLGGINGSIIGDGQYNPLHIGTVSGTAQAHTVNNVNSTGNIYCKSGTFNNKSCINQADPTYVSFPVSDANVEQWKTDASVGNTYNGNYTVNSSGDSIGPKIINGNLTVTSGGTLTITGTIWVKGNLILNGGSFTKASSSYGSNDAVVIVDGTISISGGAKALGSGTTGGYLMLFTSSNSISAMSISGDAGALIAYAPYGTITITGGSAVKAATGYKLNLTGNSSITYESGLTNNNFSSGPSGTWNIDSWKEVE